MPSSGVTLKRVDLFFGRDTMNTQEELHIISDKIIIGKPKVQVENLQSTSNYIFRSLQKSISSRQLTFKQVSNLIRENNTQFFNYTSNQPKATSIIQLNKIKFTQLSNETNSTAIPSMSDQKMKFDRSISNQNSYPFPQVSFINGAIQTSTKGGARKYIMSSNSSRMLTQIQKSQKRASYSSVPKDSNACSAASNMMRPTSVIKKNILMKPKIKRNSDV